MEPVRVTFGRTLGRARGLFSTAVAIGGFLAAVAVLFSFRLEDAEGGTLSALEIWTLCASQALPFFAAVLGMDIWAAERKSGRLEVLLATAVRERDLVMGKFFGLWLVVALTASLSLAGTVAFLWAYAPAAADGISLVGVLPAVFGLLVQGTLWCAVVCATSIVFTQAATAAGVAVLLSFALPRAAWSGLMSWSAAGRVAFGVLPLDAHALDMAGGNVSLGAVAGYLACSLAALFVAVKGVAFVRMVGRGAAGLRASALVAVALALAAAGLAVSLCSRLDVSLDLPAPGVSSGLSPRTRSILADSSGNITLTCLLPRKDVRFRSVSRFLRQLKYESESVGGARFTLQYVDPHWDIGAAERLFGRGMTDEGLVFERGRRLVVLPFKDGFGERACATAIRRLAALPRRRNVYWTVGHGESRFDDYGAFGMSDIARDLLRDGYFNRTLDLASAVQIPGDCAMIVIAGARKAFSRAELGRLESYLKEGGRLLVLMGADSDGGLAAFLPAWGIRPTSVDLGALPTISGSDVIVSDFSDHPISSALGGSRLVLERPTSFLPSVAAESVSGADRIDYSPVASVGKTAFAVLTERGSGAGQDLAIRPTRLVAVGDASFVMNGALASRANANRDFFLNCTSYLSGASVTGVAGEETGVLTTGFDRRTRLRHAVASSLLFPSFVVLVLVVEVLRRRRSRI